MLQPCDPDTTILLLRHALSSRPEDVSLEAIIDVVAQLATDLQACHASTDGSKGRWLPKSCASRGCR